MFVAINFSQFPRIPCFISRNNKQTAKLRIEMFFVLMNKEIFAFIHQVMTKDQKSRTMVPLTVYSYLLFVNSDMRYLIFLYYAKI